MLCWRTLFIRIACACICLQAQAQAQTQAQTKGQARLSMDTPLLTQEVGDAARGRAIVANRQLGLCLLCHTGPIPEERFQGNLAPDLAGAGDRWSTGQLRLRLVDPSRFNPATIMPAYFKTEGLNRVSAALKGKTILSAQQIEDVIAYLETLRNPVGN